MPFRSKAQQRFFFAAEQQGLFKKGTAKKWADETDFKHLPERIKTMKKTVKTNWRVYISGKPVVDLYPPPKLKTKSQAKRYAIGRFIAIETKEVKTNNRYKNIITGVRFQVFFRYKKYLAHYTLADNNKYTQSALIKKATDKISVRKVLSR